MLWNAFKVKDSKNYTIWDQRSGDTEKMYTQNLSGKLWIKEITKKIETNSEKIILKKFSQISYTCVDWFHTDPDSDL
jgi:hypothetical protein